MAATASSSPADWAWSGENANNPFQAQRQTLELQFLPPAATDMVPAQPVYPHATRVSTASSCWGEDPVRLQQLMMGSLAASTGVAAAASLSSSSSSPVAASISSSPTPSPSQAANAASSPSSLLLSLSSSSLQSFTVAAARSVSMAASPPSSPATDVGTLFDLDTSKPLPSGYERCLDLKSGQVFIKMRDGDACLTGTASSGVFCKPSRSTEHTHKQDWSLRRLQPKSVSSSVSQDAVNCVLPISFVCLEKRKKHHLAPAVLRLPNDRQQEDTDCVLKEVKREAEDTACLDLDLKLANQPTNFIRSSGTASNLISRALWKGDIKPAPSRLPVNSSGLLASLCPPPPLSSSTLTTLPRFIKQEQQWKWDVFRSTKPSCMSSSIQELVRNSSMATAACTNCLMYVLMKKVNPVCPRCRIVIELYEESLQSLEPQHQSGPLHKRSRLDCTQVP